MDEGGSFGSWSQDAWDLPCFDYKLADIPARFVLPEGDARRAWHQVGNDRMLATAHAGGWSTLYLTDRMWLRLSGTDPSRPVRLGGMWRVLTPEGVALMDPLEPGVATRARWGMGYAQWRATGAGVSLTRRLWAPFGGLPALRIDVEWEGAAEDAVFEERWGVAPHPIFFSPLMTRRTRAPSTHSFFHKLVWHAIAGVSSSSRLLTDLLRGLYGRLLLAEKTYLEEQRAWLLRFRYRGPFAGSEEGPAWLDGHPSPVFLACIKGEALPPAGTPTQALVLQAKGEPGEGAARRASFLIGTAQDEGEVAAVIAKAQESEIDATAAAWKRNLQVEMPAAPWLEREIPWHGYYLRSAQIQDQYFEAKILPQGSAYSYIQGLHGAVRDYALSAVPLCYIDPSGARDNLRLIMRMTRPGGAIYYAHAGVGRATWAGMHHSPSDLPLFFLWALTEFVWATGESDFLDERVSFYPKHEGRASSVRERVVLAFDYLTQRIGVGSHGLMGVGSGDWSDPISLMVRSRRAFHREGESGFNTAFAAYVLPRAADLIADSHPDVASRMRAFAGGLRQAMEQAWNGRWYLRGWDGRGRPIGDDRLFLDCQVWCLIAKIGPEERRAALVGEIGRLLDDPSPIGALILDRPHPIRLGVLADGWDCNGGVWAAINGLLAWALSLHDPARAWRNLEKQSLAAHARAYPHVWYGIWSGPDAYNAHYADRAGETFVHPATPMTEFPVMNSNAHALPLLALLRLAGVETTAEGIRVAPKIPVKGPWQIETPLLSVSSDGKRAVAKTRPVLGLGGKAAVRVEGPV